MQTLSITRTNKKKAWLLAGFIVLKFLLQYILISPEYDLHRDEYLYLDQGNHLAWGYLSVPPFISLNSFLIKLLGNTVFWIKFFPALFGALTVWVVWKTIEELKGDLFALILGASCIIFSILLRLNTLYQPNSFDVLAWAAAYFVLIKYCNTLQNKWLYVEALVLAIGFLNKYNIAFLMAGLFPAILLTQQRKIFRQGNLYLSIMLAGLLVFPNLVWQYVNHFPVVYHMRELMEKQLVHVDRWGFLRSQLLFFMGSLFVILSGLLALLFYQPFRKYKFFFFSFFFTLIVFLYFRAKDYYAIGLYPVYIAFGSVFLSHVLEGGWKKYVKPIAVAIPFLLFIPFYNVAFPNKSPEYIVHHQEKYRELGLLRWEDGKDHEIPQDFADMLGWKEMAYKVDKQYARLSASGTTLVLCDNYGEAGAVNYYTRKGVKAVSFNADYLNWFELDQTYTNLIRVKNYEEKEEELRKTSPYFKTSAMAYSITNPFAREYKTIIFVFQQANVNISQRLKSEIDQVKSNRQRKQNR